MNQSFKRAISSTVSVAMVLTLATLGATATHAAAQLTASTDSLSEVRENLTSTHTITTHVATAAAIKKVTFEYRKFASTGSTLPEQLTTSSATKSSVSIAGSDDSSNWTLDGTTTAGTLTYTATTATSALTVGDTLTFATAGIHNNRTTGSDLCDTVTNSETCFIRITTYGSDGTTVLDTGITTYTVMDAITVSATVDPILTFTVAGISSGTTSDANAGATSVTTTATTIPFGNVTLGSAKTATQSLTVLTNANNGYNVYNKFIGVGPSSDQLMVGTYTANNIDPFAGNSAGWAEDSGTPGAWTTPTGTTGSVNTGWLGIRTNNTGVSGFGSSVWAPPYVGANIGKKVMVSTTPDNGGTPTYVSYKIQANAYQPSDTYTGTTVYNVVASY